MAPPTSTKRVPESALDVVVIEWRYVEPTYGEVHRFIRTHYSGPYTLGRFVQDEIKGSAQILNFCMAPRSLSNLLKDKMIHDRPVFAYPSFKYS